MVLRCGAPLPPQSRSPLALRPLRARRAVSNAHRRCTGGSFSSWSSSLLEAATAKLWQDDSFPPAIAGRSRQPDDRLLIRGVRHYMSTPQNLDAPALPGQLVHKLPDVAIHSAVPLSYVNAALRLKYHLQRER